MNKISVVMIAKNEAHIIGQTIAAAQLFTDDIVVVDSGSTDGTCQLVEQMGARLIESEWLGYGPTKNKGIDAAKYDWILSIDCDEIPDVALAAALQSANLTNPTTLFECRFKTFFGQKLIRWGEWGGDRHIRLFNRQQVRWNDARVHEQLQTPGSGQVVPLAGYIQHYTLRDMAEYATKMTNYALLNAERYFKNGKKAGWIKRRLSHRFSFFQNYILRLGFLDGREGYIIANITAYYTFLKYERLYELRQQRVDTE